MAINRVRQRLPAGVVDAGVVAAVGTVLSAAIAVAGENDSVPPDALAFALVGTLALLTLGRHRWSLALLLLSAGLLLVYYALDYPGISPALALAVPLYIAGERGRTGWALGVVAFFLVAGFAVRAFDEREVVLALAVDTVEEASLMVVVVLLGATIRSRRLRVEAVARAQAVAEAERERDAARQVTEERLRIARELHDVLAHTLTAVTVQAGVAIDALDSAPDQARAALREVRSATRIAVDELRATVGLLREPTGAPHAPMPTLRRLDSLLDTARRSGLAVDLRQSGEVRPLPAAAELTAYRVVQESLTNVLRHSHTTAARVALDYRADALEVRVTDDGNGPGEPTDGHGIEGMRERAAVLGGSLHAGPRAEGGFEVRATLPLERPPP